MLEKSSGSVTFVYDPAGRSVGSVSVAGEFNGWNAGKNPMARGGDGKWRVTLPLAVGQYQFKYVADGQWLNDPHADGEVSNGHGGTNSVVRVSAPAAPVSAPVAAPPPAAAAPSVAAPAPAAPPPPRAPLIKSTGFTRRVQRVYIRKPPES